MELRRYMQAGEWCVVAVMLETGLRVGDVIALPRSALNGCELSFTAAKTGKAGKCTISAYLRDQIEHGANARWLFPSPYGGGQKHLSRSCVWRRIKRAGELAGIELGGVSPHSLRKVYAVRLTHKEGIRAAQEALQHTDLHTTEIYALSDWDSPENASEPLLRGDIPQLIRIIADHLFGGGS